MLYAMLKPVMRFAIWLYYRSIQGRGLERIDTDEPMLIIANHTASFMDAMVVAVHLRRRIHFFARGDAFSNPAANKILRGLGLLPVFRLSEGRENLVQNDATNEEGIEVLKHGGAVLIFAEGASDIAKILKPLKKGPFRLAVTAAGELGHSLTVVPLGINYSDATRPYATLWLNAGDEIQVEEAAFGNEAKTALQAMRATATALEPLVLDVGGKENAVDADRLIAGAEKTKGGALRWTEVRNIAVNCRGGRHVPAPWLEPYKPRFLRNAIGVLAGLPALAGLLFHAIPMAAAREIVRRKVTEEDFIAPVFIGAAVVFTMLWYFISGLMIILFFPSVTWIALLLIALSGIAWNKLCRPAWQDILQRTGNSTSNKE